MKRCFYDVLQIQRTATNAHVKDAYRAAALRLHPDRNQGLPDALREEREAQLVEVTEAYKALSDARRRREYDQTRDVNFAAAILEQERAAEAIRRENRARNGLGVEHVLERWEAAAATSGGQSVRGAAAMRSDAASGHEQDDYETRLMALERAMQMGEMEGGEGQHRKLERKKYTAIRRQQQRQRAHEARRNNATGEDTGFEAYGNASAGANGARRWQQNAGSIWQLFGPAPAHAAGSESRSQPKGDHRNGDGRDSGAQCRLS